MSTSMFVRNKPICDPRSIAILCSHSSLERGYRESPRELWEQESR